MKTLILLQMLLVLIVSAVGVGIYLNTRPHVDAVAQADDLMASWERR